MVDAESTFECHFLESQYHAKPRKSNVFESRGAERWRKVALKLTDATAQSFEVALLGPPSKAVVVDFADDSCIGTGAALWALPVAWRWCGSSMSASENSTTSEDGSEAILNSGFSDKSLTSQLPLPTLFARRPRQLPRLAGGCHPVTAPCASGYRHGRVWEMTMG